MIRSKVASHVIGALALLCGLCGLALFAAQPLGSFRVVRMEWPDTGVLLWDGLLSFAFFLQHSGMVRRQFQERAYRSVPPRYHRALYSIASGITLAAVALLWHPSSNHFLVLPRPFRFLGLALSIVAGTLFLWGALALRNVDLFGIRAIKAHAEDIAKPSPTFIVRGPYRWVRHPWYLGVLMLFWSCTDFTADRLLFNLLWTGWVYVGTVLEERDLVHEFGEAYRKYQRQVPMLVPWRRPAVT